MMILMLWLHRVHSKLLSGMLLLKASKSCPKKIFWSWCCQTASLWRKGEERLATFFGSLFFSPSVTLEMGFWYAQNCCTECNIVLYKLSVFYGDDHKSQNIMGSVWWLFIKSRICWNMSFPSLTRGGCELSNFIAIWKEGGQNLYILCGTKAHEWKKPTFLCPVIVSTNNSAIIQINFMWVSVADAQEA